MKPIQATPVRINRHDIPPERFLEALGYDPAHFELVHVWHSLTGEIKVDVKRKLQSLAPMPDLVA